MWKKVMTITCIVGMHSSWNPKQKLGSFVSRRVSGGLPLRLGLGTPVSVVGDLVKVAAKRRG